METEEIKWILENNYKILSRATLEEQTEDLMKLLGSPNTILREGALDIIYNWIFNGHFLDEKLISLGERLSNNLLHGIGEKNTDTVFLRSFSALILAGIIDYDEQMFLQRITDRKPFLSKERILIYLNTSIQYYRKEKDPRGFIKNKEWAHSIAHGADLLRNFGRSHHLGKSELKMILDTLGDKITEPFDDIFGAFEDFRISTAVYSIFFRNVLSIEEINKWLQDLANVYFQTKWIISVKDPIKRNAVLNTRMFFYSFYFMVKFGISKRGWQFPSNENNMLPDKEQICKKLEDIFFQIENGFFLHKG